MSEIFENNPAPVNNIDNNTSTPESNIENQDNIQIEPTLLAILQIEEKYEYIDKIRELKQYIDKLIKRINIVKQGKNNNTEETLNSEEIEILRKISDIIDTTLDVLKYLPPENVKLIHSNLLLLIEKILNKPSGGVQ